MDNLNELKKVWLTANTTILPGSDELVKAAKAYRSVKLRNKILVIVIGLLLNAFMVAIMLDEKLSTLSTRLGAVFTLIAGMILVITNSRSIGRFYHFNDFSNQEYIKFLKQTRLNQIRFYKKTQLISLIFSSVGLLLFVFQVGYKNGVTGIVVYLLAIGYLFYTWLVLRPSRYKAQSKKINEKITKLETILATLEQQDK
jgi:hypothetical protein